MTTTSVQENGSQPPSENNKETQEKAPLAVQQPAASGALSLKTVGNRPVSSSNLRVAETFSTVGTNRPIAAGDLQVVSTMKASGNRPISSSGLAISTTYSVMGNRPVASNEIDDSETLMGYID